MTSGNPRPRPATTSDSAGIWAMLKPVFRTGETYAIDSDIGETEALAYWTADHAFVVEDGGALLGTYYIRANQAGGGDHICNAGFVTAPDAAGRGIARIMLEDALTQARALGFEAMQFNFVLANNARAIDIWRRAGFAEIGRIPRAFRHPREGYVDALILWKELNDE